jgi:ABC-2 type transport system ATP-binding protein
VSLSVTAVHRALPALLEAVSAAGVEVRGLTMHRATLEDVFVHLTGRALRDV